MVDREVVLHEIRGRIAELGISETVAARMIGVTSASLARHLGGAYVRSDSLAKYRRWLADDLPAKQSVASVQSTKQQENALEDSATEVSSASADELLIAPPNSRGEPYRVVDLFSGCGGLSLGFELAGTRDLYRTVLAVDVEEPMVRVFNANHPHAGGPGKIGRQADLSEFLNEAEVLAYYLDHLAATEADLQIVKELDSLVPIGLNRISRLVQDCDAEFVANLRAARSDTSFREAYKKIPKTSLSQTSVIGFHNALKLPRPGTNEPHFDAPLWGRATRDIRTPESFAVTLPQVLLEETRTSAEALWNQEISRLRARADGTGSGQLASAARKIQTAIGLIDGPAYGRVRDAWMTWRVRRDAIRRFYFENEDILAQLRQIYMRGREVDVLLGGPPCQGFSRIGRGKIRSLREQSVHVQSDQKAGDKRNELMHKYVLFVAALAPSVFLFENVRHFQSEVKTPDGVFNATEVLEEAIANISHDGLKYGIGSRVLVASDHLIPQARERFFMVGLRLDIQQQAGRDQAASWCLALGQHPTVPLKTALAGLPEPVYASLASERAGGTDTLIRIDDPIPCETGSTGEYTNWIRQPAPPDRPQHDHRLIDGHCTRDSRADDRAFFAMIAPGKRWMDYRCDDSPLVSDLARVVSSALASADGGDIAGLTNARVRELIEALDGSLSLRLLLERIPLEPGETSHHLAGPNYLRKREGSHGDWLARLDSESPSKTMVSHMGKDAYAYIHPSAPRTISVREAARVQTFPDWFSFGNVGLVDAYRVIGNAVPPLLSMQLAVRVAVLLEAVRTSDWESDSPGAGSRASDDVPLDDCLNDSDEAIYCVLANQGTASDE